LTRRSLQEWFDLTDELYTLGAFGREKNVRARSRRDRFKRRIVASMYRAARARARQHAGRGGGPIGGEVGTPAGADPPGRAAP
jgi:hypothetical protein